MVTVEDQAVSQAALVAKAKAEALGSFVLALAEKVVAEEKASRRYSDRTGKLVNSTRAYLEANSPALVTVVLAMDATNYKGVSYAHFITDGTYGARGRTYPSLSDFRETAGKEFKRTMFRALSTYFDTSSAGFSASVSVV